MKPFLLMGLLALQLATLPRLVRSFGSPNAVVSSCILISEALKVVIGAAFFYWNNPNKFQSFQSARVILREGFITAAPAAIVYAGQNLAIAHAQRHLDGITYNILNQSKLLSAAVMGYWILGRKQSKRQMIALFLLFGASVLAVSSTPRVDVAANPNEAFGLIAAIIGSGLSGLSGALSDLAMRKRSRDAFLFSAEISFYVFLTTFLGLIVDHIFKGPLSDVSRIISAGGLFAAAGVHSFHSPALIPIVSAAFGGILVGQVTKLVGSVRKGFAVCAGIVLTALIEATDRRNMTVLVSILIAALAVILHSTTSVSIMSERRKIFL